MESRTICGNQCLLPQLAEMVSPEKIWPSAEFFKAKWEEQIGRHKKFNNTEYNLEPNVKNSPGTLRDIQTINWMAMRHFGHEELEELKQYKFLTQFELDQYQRSTEFLWQLRYAVNRVMELKEDVGTCAQKRLKKCTIFFILQVYILNNSRFLPKRRECAYCSVQYCAYLITRC